MISEIAELFVLKSKSAINHGALSAESPWNQGVDRRAKVHMRQKKSKCLRANVNPIRGLRLRAAILSLPRSVYPFSRSVASQPGPLLGPTSDPEKIARFAAHRLLGGRK
jgi:hypothetical protein